MVSKDPVRCHSTPRIILILYRAKECLVDSIQTVKSLMVLTRLFLKSREDGRDERTFEQAVGWGHT